MTYDDAQEVYEVARNASGPISLSEAKLIFNCGNERGAASHIKAAYWFFYHNGDDVKCNIIGRSFVDKNGDYPTTW